MIVTDAGRVRWTRQRFACDGIAGRVGEPVSDQSSGRGCCGVRRSRVVLTPRRWRQVCGVASAQPGLDKTYPQATVAKSPVAGRARRKPLKPLRAGMPVIRCTRCCSCAFYHYHCTRDRGYGHPAFPTPSLGGDHQRLGRIARRVANVGFVAFDNFKVGVGDVLASRATKRTRHARTDPDLNLVKVFEEDGSPGQAR